MKLVAEMRHDMIGITLLTLLALLTIIQVLLIRSEYIKQFASIRLSQDLANIIHDVRIPQQVAASAVSMILLPDTDPSTVKEMIQAVAHSLSAMQRLLDTALLRVKAGVKPVPVRLTEAFQDICTIHEAACREKSLLWRFYLAPSAKGALLVDANVLIQMLV
ncbi:hypothetical protein BVRB_037030 [Beta vulgaris subsp. vulgaris]|uniref:Uncharacterized protein n=1 Tax=Beta vulgaris subsp. vulgaris TaxID=3555 RepID=A0A0J8BHZ0_BETVV|nr:hypothetical protein BVRB_037030 [Beta vulgaris subsp. vulgaris]